LQGQKQGAEALEILHEVAKRFPQGVYGYLARHALSLQQAISPARLVMPSRRKLPLLPMRRNRPSKGLIDRLEAKQDITSNAGYLGLRDDSLDGTFTGKCAVCT